MGINILTEMWEMRISVLKMECHLLSFDLLGYCVLRIEVCEKVGQWGLTYLWGHTGKERF